MSEILSWLPPNLQPSSTKPDVPLLIIKITKITYLQVFFHKPTIIKYKWWGLKAKKSQQTLVPDPTKMQIAHSFYVSVSLSMFLRYCSDMKVLQFELCDSADLCLARGHINFLLLKGWGGEQCQLVIDLKQPKNNSKIGEMHIKIQIKNTQNPIYNTQKHQIQTNRIPINRQTDQNKKSWISIHKRQNEQSRKGQKQTYNQIDIDQIHTGENNFINYRIQQQQIYNNTNKQLNKLKKDSYAQKMHPSEKYHQKDDIKIKWYKKLNLPLPDDCICQDIRPNRHHLEKIRLKQQIDMLFASDSTEFIQNQQVYVEFLGWQASNKNESKLGCKIFIPILDADGSVYKNEHYFPTGRGHIKIQIGTKSNKLNYETIIKQYLSQNSLQVVIGDAFVGNLQMYKLIGSKGDIISIGVYQNKNKRQILKGHFLLKLIPYKKLSNPPLSQHPKNQKTIQKKQNKQEYKQTQYIWLYLRQMHFLQPKFWQNSNIYIHVKTPIQEQKTKTIWKSDSPIFNQIITVKMPNKQIILQFWNRQATQRLIGKAILSLNTKMEFDVELPIIDNYNRSVAYLNLCIGKGDVTAATQFLNAHARAFHQKSSRQNNISYSPRTQPLPVQQPQHQHNESSSLHSSSEHHNEDEIRQNSSSQDMERRIIPNPPHKEQLNLDIIQIHNKIFTEYIGKQYDWLQTYQNQQLSMAQFCHLLKSSLIGNNNLIKMASVYLNSQTNNISLKEIRQSFQAFQVYYNILVQQRNMALSNLIEELSNQGININDIEYKINQKIKSGKGNKKDLIWRALKQYLQSNLVEKVRYFYQNLNINQLCDCLRRFEVYETTKGQQLNKQSIIYQISKQISDLLDIDNHTNTIRQALKQTGLELSKYQLLCLFGSVDVKKQEKKPKDIQMGKMVKSPTFGYLGTDRLPIVSKPLIQKNQSIDMRIEAPSNKSDISAGLSQKFGYPNISPINKDNKRRKPTVVVKLMDFQEEIQLICINNEQFDVNSLQISEKGQIFIEMIKKFNYEGYLIVRGDIKLQFEGPAGQWIGLIDQNGEYCGSIIFQ